MLDKQDCTIAGILAIVIFIGICIDIGAPGVTWDEAYPSFPNAKSQAEWLTGVFTLLSPFSQETIDSYWQSTSDHPTLHRTISAVSYLIFSPIVDEIIALRLPSVINFSLLVASIFFFLRLFIPKPAAIAGALSLALMPRIYGHAHLFSLDVPIMCWWFWTAVIGFLVYHGKLRPFFFGLFYAIAFSTKLHAVFLPFPFLTWIVIQIAFQRTVWREKGKIISRAVIWACILTPLIYIGSQPWLWHDTFQRIGERFLDYASKVPERPIPLFYFGNIYDGNTPWHYPLVMFGFTVPVVILLLWFVGSIVPLINQLTKKEDSLPADSMVQEYGLPLFLLFHFFTPLLLLLLPLAQGYDGCRLFLPAFPFAAAIVGIGYHVMIETLRSRFKPIFLHIVLYCMLIIPSLYTYIQISPFYLAYYNELVGGIRGAKELGMESTYWCDALVYDFLVEMNDHIPEGAKLKPCSMSYPLIDYYKQRGWLRDDIDHVAEPPWDYYLLQCRQGMFRQLEWYLFKQQKAISEIQVDGVPLFRLYGPVK